MSNAASKCDEYKELLSQYADNELELDKHREIDLHLSSCVKCTGELDGIRNLSALFASLPKLKMSKEIDFSFLDKIDGESSYGPSCQQVRLDLSAFHDKELETDKVSSIEKHLQQCQECRIELEKVAELAFDLNNLPRLKAPTELAEKLDLRNDEQTCASLRQNLDAYVDAELEAAEMASAKAHIEDCADCSKQLELTSLILDGIKASPRLTCPKDIAGELNFEANAGAAESAKVLSLLSPRKTRIWWGLGSVAACAAVLILFLGQNAPVTKDRLATNQSPKIDFNTKPEQDPSQAVRAEMKPNNTHQDGLIAEKPAESELGKGKNENLAQTSSVYPPAKQKEFKIMIADKNKETGNLVKPESQESEIPSELALMPDSVETTADALGIATDEDGLYDIKI